jgi:galactonate dehydratase
VQALGFDAVKFCPIETLREVDDPRIVREAAETVGAVRDAVGTEMKLAIDVACRLGPVMAIQFARAVEEYDIWFIEEPVRAENPEALALVARSTSVALAAGEQLLTRWGFRELLDLNGVALIQPDVAHCGGIAETRRVAAMAEVDYVGLAPHNPLSPVNTAASAHVAMATPNFIVLEYKVESDLPWLPDASVPWRDTVVDAPLQLNDSALTVTSAPGLGIELDWEACLAHPAPERQLSLPLQRDGAIAEY